MAIKLLADSMLGSLARWLRLLGYDTALAQREPDALIVRQARAEERVILTRDRELARRRGVQTLLIAADDLDAQLAQVADELPLPPPQPGARCPYCNVALHEVSPEQVADKAPPYVLRTQPDLRLCPSCDRVYWQGSHWPGIEERLAALRRPR